MVTLRDYNVRTGANEGCTVALDLANGVRAYWAIPDNAIVAATNEHLAVAVGSGRLSTAFGAYSNAPWLMLGLAIATITGIDCVLLPLNTTVVWPPLKHWLAMAEYAAREFAATSQPAARPSRVANPSGFENVRGELRLLYFGEMLVAETSTEAFVAAVIAYIACVNNPMWRLREFGIAALCDPNWRNASSGHAIAVAR